MKVNADTAVYRKKTFIINGFISFAKLLALSGLQTKCVNLYSFLKFEKISVKKIRKNKPPIHCDEDLHKINVGSKYLILLKTVKPVFVKPETDSKKESINDN